MDDQQHNDRDTPSGKYQAHEQSMTADPQHRTRRGRLSYWDCQCVGDRLAIAEPTQLCGAAREDTRRRPGGAGP
jgi:hypothetical protein